MPVTLDKTVISQDSALPISNDAHCQRVARLAGEIGRRFGLNSTSIGFLSEAAIQHHPMVLHWNEDGQQKFGLPNKDQPEMALEIIEALRAFNGIDQPKPGSQTGILSEILRLANAFDESYEWRVFESNPASESIKELDLLMESGLWSQQVNQAFHAIFSGNRDRALAKAEKLPLSTVSKIQKLAFASADDLTVNGLEQMALADPVISADLLRSVNSAKYAVTDRVRSVGRAIGYMGTTAARDVMLVSAARGIFAFSSLHRLWKHSVRCANTMKAVACQAGLDQNRAFLLGLLHDIGRMSLECLDTVTRSGHTRICEAEAPAIWTEMAIAGCDHAELGADILAGWNFPECIVESVRNHHSPQLSAEKLTALLYLVECVEGADEDLASSSRFAEALSKIEMSQGQFREAVDGKARLGKAVALAC